MNTQEEIWKNFPGYEGRYQGSNLGNVRSIKNGKIHILKPVRYNNDREMVHIYNNGIVKRVYIYNFIWICFNGPILEGYEIHHRDFNHNNNNLDNLQMLSKEEHRKLHGIKPVECYDLEGNLVAKYDSIYQAAKSVGHPESPGNITSCCQGRYKYAYGFIWKYKN